MSNKQITSTAMRMYLDIVKSRFEGIDAILAAREESIRPKVKQLVKHELGVYDLLAKQAVLQTQLQEVEDQIREKIGNRWSAGTLDKAVNKKLEELNPLRKQVQDYRNSIIETVQLSLMPDSIVEVIQAMKGDIEQMMNVARTLPAIEEIEPKLALIENVEDDDNNPY
jgi:hypothetical protein